MADIHRLLSTSSAKKFLRVGRDIAAVVAYRLTSHTPWMLQAAALYRITFTYYIRQATSLCKISYRSLLLTSTTVLGLRPFTLTPTIWTLTSHPQHHPEDAYLPAPRAPYLPYLALKTTSSTNRPPPKISTPNADGLFDLNGSVGICVDM